MLVLSRKRGENILIGDEIVVTVVSIQGKRVRLGIRAPAWVQIHRLEILPSWHARPTHIAGDSDATSGFLEAGENSVSSLRQRRGGYGAVSSQRSGMLVLTRSPGQSIAIDHSIVITVLRTRRTAVRLGIEAPRELPILREECRRPGFDFSGFEDVLFEGVADELEEKPLTEEQITRTAACVTAMLHVARQSDENFNESFPMGKSSPQIAQEE